MKMLRPLVATAVVALVAGWSGSASPQHVTLTRRPYLGLACRGGVHPCHRLGLAVWLARPARSVSAVVDGQSFGLRTGPGNGAYRQGLFWQGFFADRRAEQLADAFPHALSVRVRVVAADGTVLRAQRAVPVSSGYG